MYMGKPFRQFESFSCCGASKRRKISLLPSLSIWLIFIFSIFLGFFLNIVPSDVGFQVMAPGIFCGLKPLLFGGKASRFEVLKSVHLRKTPKKNEEQGLNMQRSRSRGSTVNFILMMELKKKIFAFRDIIDLLPCDGSASITELMIVTMIDLHKLYPEIIPTGQLAELKGAPINKVLDTFSEALRSTGDSWMINREWMDKATHDMYNRDDELNIDQLVEVALAILNCLIKIPQGMLDRMDEDHDHDQIISKESPRTSGFCKFLTSSYSDSNNSFCFSPVTPTSVLPEFTCSPRSEKFGNSYLSSSPLLKSVRVQAVGKLNPIYVKRLSFQMLPNGTQDCSSTSKNQDNNVDDDDDDEMMMAEVEAKCRPLSPKSNNIDDELMFEMETSNSLEVTRAAKNPEDAKETTRATTKATGLSITPPVPVFSRHAAPVLPPPPPSIRSSESALQPSVLMSLPPSQALLPTLQSNVAPKPPFPSPPPPPPPPPTPPPPPSILKPTEVAPIPPPPPLPPMPQLTEVASMPPPPLPPIPMLQPNVVAVVASVPSLPLPPSPMLQRNVAVPLPPPPPSRPGMTSGPLTPPSPPPTLPTETAVPPPPLSPPPMMAEKGSMPRAPPPRAPLGHGAALTPPPGSARSLRPKKAQTKLKRSSQMSNLYRALKGKLEGGNQNNKSQNGRKGSAASSAGGKQGLADALAEMTKRSAYFQQIEDDVKKYSKSITELKTAISTFKTSDLTELLKFHKHVESILENLTDETQVLARFEGFPQKKLEALRTAAALSLKLTGIVSELQNWKIEAPLGQLLDRTERYFNKIKGEIDALERTKDEESKKFQSHNITFDFHILVQIKESMVDVSSNCMELALKERRDATAVAAVETAANIGTKNETKKTCSKMLWRAFQFAFRVYTFAGGHDDRAEKLTRELAREIETDSQHQ